MLVPAICTCRLLNLCYEQANSLLEQDLRKCCICCGKNEQFPGASEAVRRIVGLQSQSFIVGSL